MAGNVAPIHAVPTPRAPFEGHPPATASNLHRTSLADELLDGASTAIVLGRLVGRLSKKDNIAGTFIVVEMSSHATCSYEWFGGQK